MRGRVHTSPPAPPPDRDNYRGGTPRLGWEHEHARVPLPVYLLMAAIVIAIVVHGLLTAAPRRCAMVTSLPTVEARR